jgi:protocatechuate 3,4-dioxygenase beta subunit
VEHHDEHDDDIPVGRVLSRREVLGLLGGAGAALLAGCNFAQFGLGEFTEPTASSGSTTNAALPTCVARPEMTEGPYFVDTGLNRSDIRSDPATGEVQIGLPLRLVFHVSQIDPNACVPLAGALVDVWHCNALGVYSGVQDRSFDTSAQQFLRGYQVTDANGNAEFQTIYPGWYSGRAVHIHFKIRTDPDSNQGYEFTSQLFFDDSLSAQVYTQEPYASKGIQDRLNTQDGIYQNGGDGLLLQVTQEADGYVALFDVGLDVS